MLAAIAYVISNLPRSAVTRWRIEINKKLHSITYSLCRTGSVDSVPTLDTVPIAGRSGMSTGCFQKTLHVGQSRAKTVFASLTVRGRLLTICNPTH
jgi:hypothetical protein